MSRNKAIIRSDSTSDRLIDKDAEHLARAREQVVRSEVVLLALEVVPFDVNAVDEVALLL